MVFLVLVVVLSTTACSQTVEGDPLDVLSRLVDRALGFDVQEVQTEQQEFPLQVAKETPKPVSVLENRWSFEFDQNKMDFALPHSIQDRPTGVQAGFANTKNSNVDLVEVVKAKRQRDIQRCLAMYYRIIVDTKMWRPWTIMHGLLPYGKLSRVNHNGNHYSAVDYLCNNAIGNDTYMMYTSGNSLGVSVGPGVQGHEGQFLAMLAQAGVDAEQEIRINGKQFTVKDLVETEKKSCQQNTELTFKLIGLSHYVDSDEIWTNSNGQSWNIERLIYEELKQPINGAACGGTHRLMGLSFAINRRESSGRPVNGQWIRAKKYVTQYQQYAMSFQNPDGSFSTSWFEGKEADNDLKKRLYTTGHMVEWLSFSLPQEQLEDPSFQRAVDYLVNLMLTAPAMDLEIGPKGHALHALRIFERRLYGENSDVERINSMDLAAVERSLRMQQQMKPEFSAPSTNSTFNNVSYSQDSNVQGLLKTGPSRRFRRRR